MLKKQYVKSRKVVKVTFELLKSEQPEEIDVENVHLVGEFNEWDLTATPMKANVKGAYRTMLELEPDRAYKFRYLVNGEYWCNDWQADSYEPNYLDGDNCVVVTPSGTA